MSRRHYNSPFLTFAYTRAALLLAPHLCILRLLWFPKYRREKRGELQYSISYTKLMHCQYSMEGKLNMTEQMYFLCMTRCRLGLRIFSTLCMGNLAYLKRMYFTVFCKSPLKLHIAKMLFTIALISTVLYLQYPYAKNNGYIHLSG